VANLQASSHPVRDTVRRARAAETVEDERGFQQELRALDRRERRQRHEVFAVEDDIEGKRDQLIAALERRLKQKTVVHPLFRVRWQLVLLFLASHYSGYSSSACVRVTDINGI
jgi:hypothetical protein